MSLSVVQNPLFIERKMPSSFEGKPVNQDSISLIHQQIRQNFFNKDWHHKDEENFFDLRTRARNARDWILAQQKNNVAVVTHGYFLTIMLYDLLFGEPDNHHSFRLFKKRIEFSNGGLTVVEYHDDSWKVLSMNR